MKFCRPKYLLALGHSLEEITSQAAVTKFFMSAADFYLAVLSNCLLVLGYALGKIYCDEIEPCFTGTILVILGHSLGLLSDAFTVLEDVLYVKQYKRDFSVNRYFVIANILTIIGEYQELKSSLRGT
ncbi:uncharacterized protein LOC114361147 [Ostrinia furnacalis]|uniref:uncharacterized protein LOC114361147 n=1 Tax=Ostrinia furnacalis TaxID=93504 RepID=UPI00103D8A15|nr:uncharacterized protein LOC114361147 [Ostrinia furnacalis]